MKALVIGGCGFIGSWIVKELCDSGHEVVCFDLKEPSDEHAGLWQGHENAIASEQGDVQDMFTLTRVVEAHKPDVVVHMSAIIARFGDSNPLWSTHVNIAGVLNAFELVRTYGMRRVVYASSTAVFKGYHPRFGGDGNPVPPDAPLDPRNVYGSCKAFSERLGKHYWNLFGVSSIGTRFGVIQSRAKDRLGRDKRITEGGFVYEMLEKPAIGEAGFVSLSQEACEWIFVQDAARAVRMACESDIEGAKVYSIGADYAPVKDAAAVVKRVLPDAKIEFGDEIRWEPLQPPLDTSVTKSEFGFTAEPEDIEDRFRMVINRVRREAGLSEV